MGNNSNQGSNNNNFVESAKLYDSMKSKTKQIVFNEFIINY